MYQRRLPGGMCRGAPPGIVRRQRPARQCNLPLIYAQGEIDRGDGDQLGPRADVHGRAGVQQEPVDLVAQAMAADGVLRPRGRPSRSLNRRQSPSRLSPSDRCDDKSAAFAGLFSTATGIRTAGRECLEGSFGFPERIRVPL